MDFIRKLHIPDYISITGLLCAWISIILIIQGKPNWAIIVNITAFIFDLLDGYSARKMKRNAKIGREIDSMVDVFTYVIFSSLFYFNYLSPFYGIGIIGGFLIIVFGILRLIRFNTEGILKDTVGNYYRGVTVVHINLIIFICYFCGKFSPFWTDLIPSILIISVSPFMLSNFKSYKWNSLYYALIGILFLLLGIFSEYGYHK